MRYLYVIAGFFAADAALADAPVLTVYTYDSFVSDWGPGPAVEAAFEETCGCDLQFVAAGDGAALLSRLRLEGAASPADVALGLDANMTVTAGKTTLFSPHGQTAQTAIPGYEAWKDPLFLPYDWGYFAFVYNSETTPDVPHNFTDLAASDLKIVIQDPRSSTPGLGLLLWMHNAYTSDAQSIWQDLADNIVTVTPGWSEAYGLFLEGEADMVLSYTTSPSYHAIAEGDARFKAAQFDEGHYMQIEVMGKLASTDQPELADQFLAFMLSDQVQALLPTTNWMYPAISPAAGWPEGFAQPLTAEQSLLFTPEEAAQNRGPALDAWRRALSQ
jgi:thiamine transport system substrate-binding protein